MRSFCKLKNRARLNAFFILPFLLLASCSQPPDKNKAQIRPHFIFNTKALVSQFGGVMIYGASVGGMIFALDVNSESENPSINLPNDVWHFFALSWNGDGVGNKLSGTVKCAVSKDNPLVSSPVTVNLTLSSPNCTFPDFGDASFRIGDQFFPLALHSCNGLSSVSNYSSSCSSNTGNSGNAQSYRIILPSYSLRPASSLVGNGTGLLSACQNVAGSEEKLVTSIKIPSSSSFNANSPFRLNIISYNKADCTGDLKEFSILSSFSGDAQNSWKAYPDAENNLFHIYLNTALPAATAAWDLAIWDSSSWQ